jgi:hypothetical protein
MRWTSKYGDSLKRTLDYTHLMNTILKGFEIHFTLSSTKHCSAIWPSTYEKVFKWDYILDQVKIEWGNSHIQRWKGVAKKKGLRE